MASSLSWGILGAGRIARTFAQALPHSKTGKLVAVASRGAEEARQFANDFKVERSYGSGQELLNDPAVQAVYIATPHPSHAEWAIRAAAAGKAVLCEKPLALTWPQSMAMVEAARRYGTFLMEGFMYRCHPLIPRLLDLIRSQAIGEIRLIRCEFGYDAPFNARTSANRIYNNELGGGGIMDMGCYAVSLARLIAGAANGKQAAEDPVSVSGGGKLSASGVDAVAVASLVFPGGILAQLSTGVGLGLWDGATVLGSKGRLRMPKPFDPPFEGGSSSIFLAVGEDSDDLGPENEIRVDSNDWLFALEADAVAAGLEKGQAAYPAPDWADSLGNMEVLDKWREAVGVAYPGELPENQALPLGRPRLDRRQDVEMKMAPFAALGRPAARLIMGTADQWTLHRASVVYDDYIERGGNFFDTAHMYGWGKAETVLGQWIKNRGLRKDVIILGKGAITPTCNPKDMGKQLLISLERLQTDYVDLYMLHRDNPEVPVAEFIDALNEHLRAGRIRAFGGSNWSVARLDEANAYARKKGLQGFSSVSNQFSLARMVNPVWNGCLSSWEPGYRAWLRANSFPLVAWSSQARGFFLDSIRPEARPNEEVVRGFYSEDNFERLRRVRELARQQGCLPITLALSWVLHQPFPTFAAIGPRSIEETRTSCEALKVELSEEQVKWLNLDATRALLPTSPPA